MKAFLFILFLFASLSIWGQDERYYRKVYSGELVDETSQILKQKISVKSPNYRLDLNRDGFDEIINTEKRDGSDYFIIKDHFGRVILEKKLSAIGAGGVVYRVQLKTISSNTDALIIHYYEGAIDATNFVATARLYFLTVTNKDLRRLNFYKGPHFFNETENFPNKYSIKRLSVNTVDYNKDGVKEISVSFKNISRVYFYLAEGVWQMI